MGVPPIWSRTLEIRWISVLGRQLSHTHIAKVPCLQLQARFAWVFRMLEQNPEERDFDASLAFPEASPEEQLRQMRAVREWLQKSPLGRRPLVKVGAPLHAGWRVLGLSGQVRSALQTTEGGSC